MDSRQRGLLITDASKKEPSRRHLAVRVEGRNCTDKQGLISTLAAALRFPAYSRPNWDSLEECLRDMEWLADEFDSCQVVVSNADYLLVSEPAELRIALSVLRNGCMRAEIATVIELVITTADGLQRLQAAGEDAGR